MRTFRNIPVEADAEAMPSKQEEPDIKPLFRTGSTSDILGFMCKRCGSSWKVYQKRAHERGCIHFQRS